jgi:hypothetical protein
VLTALVTADITAGTGRFNLALGIVGTASGIGASISTTLSGLEAERLGPSAVFPVQPHRFARNNGCFVSDAVTRPQTEQSGGPGQAMRARTQQMTR